MKMHYLKLQNYRCFDTLELSFHPELTVIVGANGAGKSALLDAVTVAFGPYLAKFDDSKGDGFKQSDARRVCAEHNAFEMLPQYPLRLDAIAEWTYPDKKAEKMAYQSPNQFRLKTAETPAELLADVYMNSYQETQDMLRQQSWGQQAWYWRRELLGPKNITTNKDAKYLYAYAAWLQKTLRTGSDLILPVLGHYGTGRLWALQKLSQSAEHLLSGSRTLGYRECLNKSSSFKEFAHWFQQLHLAIVGNRDLMEQGLPAPHDDRLKAIRQAVVDAINICLAESEWADLHYSTASQEIQVHKRNGGGVMPVSQLSDGIRSVLALAADIAFRCCKLNGHLGTLATQQTPGIVLIDELDLHLHPAWQQTIVQAFRQAFPKIQFILTTHSPQLLTTVDKSSIRILQWEETDAGLHCHVETPEYQTLGVASYETLARLMQIDPVPQVKQSQWLSRYRQYIEQDQAETADAEELRKKLEDHFGPTHPEILDCDRLLRFQKFKRKSLKQES